MWDSDIGSDDAQRDPQGRLQRVRTRFDELLIKQPKLRQRVTDGTRRCETLALDQFAAEKRDRERNEEKVKTLLRSGKLREQHPNRHEGWTVETIEGLVPAALPDKIEAVRAQRRKREERLHKQAQKEGRSLSDEERRLVNQFDDESWPDALREEVAAALLAAIERREKYTKACREDDGLAEKMAEDYRRRVTGRKEVDFRGHVWYRYPEGLEEAVYPTTDSKKEFIRFSYADRLLIAFARLGGLWDASSLSPIVASRHADRPERDQLENMILFLLHDRLLPVVDRSFDGEQIKYNPSKLPPDVAERLIELVDHDLASAAQWLSSTELKERFDLTPQQLAMAAKRGRLHPQKRGKLLFYDLAEVRDVYPAKTRGL